MPRFSGLPVIYSIKPLESESTESHSLGTVGYTSDGRKFRYAKAGATALVAGDILQSPAEVTNHQGRVPTAATAGATSITVALGATAATENQYAEGYLVVTTTPGNGLYYKIKGHPAVDASGSLVAQLEQPLKVSLTASSRVDLVMNPFNGVLQALKSSRTGGVVGVAMFAVPASEFCWVQTGGAGIVRADADADLTVGTHLVMSSTTAGCAMACADSTAGGTGAIIGTAMTGITSGEEGMAMLRIDN